MRSIIAVLAICGLIFAGLYFDYKFKLENLNQSTALVVATETMERVCAEQCREKGIERYLLEGPFEALINFKNKKHYEFSWRYHDKKEFLVVVADAGWTVSINYWWLE